MDGGTSNLCPEPVVRFGTLFFGIISPLIERWYLHILLT